MSAEIKKIKLETPLEMKHKGVKTSLTEVVIGIPRAKHMRLIPDMFFEESDVKKINPVIMFPLIAALSGLPKTTVDELAFPDIIKIIEIVSEQLGEAVASEKTGDS